jgi:hypothetical protein
MPLEGAGLVRVDSAGAELAFKRTRGRTRRAEAASSPGTSQLATAASRAPHRRRAVGTPPQVHLAEDTPPGRPDPLDMGRTPMGSGRAGWTSPCRTRWVHLRPGRRDPPIPRTRQVASRIASKAAHGTPWMLRRGGLAWRPGGGPPQRRATKACHRRESRHNWPSGEAHSARGSSAEPRPPQPRAPTPIGRPCGLHLRWP